MRSVVSGLLKVIPQVERHEHARHSDALRQCFDTARQECVQERALRRLRTDPGKYHNCAHANATTANYLTRNLTQLAAI